MLKLLLNIYHQCDFSQFLILKVDDEIQFVPNISSVEGEGLQLWMNALQSGKDVYMLYSLIINL